MRNESTEQSDIHFINLLNFQYNFNWISPTEPLVYENRNRRGIALISWPVAQNLKFVKVPSRLLFIGQTALNTF